MSLLIETWRNQNPDAPAGRRFAGTATTRGKRPAMVWHYGPTEAAVRTDLETLQAKQQVKAAERDQRGAVPAPAEVRADG